jgi:DNA-binding transcriptional regulator YiaG
LSNVILENVYRVSCEGCDDLDGVEIPALDKLHRLIVHDLVHAKQRLSGSEIRFLRTFLGWSGKTFAKKLGVEPETVSRWEHGVSEMMLAYERLLRLYAASGQHDCNYSVEDSEEVEPIRTAARDPVRLRPANSGWEAPVLQPRARAYAREACRAP